MHARRNARLKARRNTMRSARSGPARRFRHASAARPARGWLLAAGLAILAPLAGGVSACGVTDNEALPPGVPDPADVQTQAGALARYHGAIDSLPRTFGFVVRDGNALPTDELTAILVGTNQSEFAGLDSRQGLGDAGNGLYSALHKLRGQAREARGVLASHAPESPAALRGQLYVEEAYAEVFLADLFCSGIPLSTVDYGADYTLDTARSTKGVYQHAVALFDSALALTGDSLAWQYLATVGKGRALLALDSVSAAVTTVAAVPDNYQYQVQATVVTGGIRGWFWSGTDVGSFLRRLTVGDREGLNGLDFRSSGDPRTPTQAQSFSDDDGNVYTAYVPDPLRYPLDGTVAATFTLANGVEARLIEAEGALRTGDAAAWRDKLNALRTDGTFEEPSPGDTLWHAGTGGIAGLAPLADPGSDAARVDLLFRERAFWLYLTGHRLGDLRRLVRVPYNRPPTAVFPSGLYVDGFHSYSNEIVFPVPETERTYNPKYTGCINHNA